MFTPPHSIRIALSRPIWVKGKGLPKEGVQLFHEGEEVKATFNGSHWTISTWHNSQTITIVVIIEEHKRVK